MRMHTLGQHAQPGAQDWIKGAESRVPHHFFSTMWTTFCLVVLAAGAVLAQPPPNCSELGFSNDPSPGIYTTMYIASTTCMQL